VAHACNPSYSGGREQEDLGSKPALASSSGDHILEKTHNKKRAGGVAQGVGPEFKPQHSQKKKKKREIVIHSPPKRRERMGVELAMIMVFQSLFPVSVLIAICLFKYF
jgi:hypothetical protein